MRHGVERQVPRGTAPLPDPASTRSTLRLFRLGSTARCRSPARAFGNTDAIEESSRAISGCSAAAPRTDEGRGGAALLIRRGDGTKCSYRSSEGSSARALGHSPRTTRERGPSCGASEEAAMRTRREWVVGALGASVAGWSVSACGPATREPESWENPAALGDYAGPGREHRPAVRLAAHHVAGDPRRRHGDGERRYGGVSTEGTPHRVLPVLGAVAAGTYLGTRRQRARRELAGPHHPGAAGDRDVGRLPEPHPRAQQGP